MLVEFAGLPRSGKSSAVDTVRDYLLRKNTVVKLIGDTAKYCPFSNKSRLYIASWVANNALNAVIEAKLSLPGSTVILQDRGLFDALAFFHLLELENLINNSELRIFVDYFTNPVWTRFVDVTFLFQVSPQTAVNRDLATQIGHREGTITNLQTLAKLSKAYSIAQEQYAEIFNIEVISTDYESREGLIRPSQEQERTARKIIASITKFQQNSRKDFTPVVEG